MPRPAIKGRRQNHYNKFSPRQPSKQSNSGVHREYLQKKLANVKVGRKPENSDDSDNVVTTRSSGRNRKSVEVYASGGVGKGDKPGGLPDKAQRTRNLREDTEEILSQRSRSTSRATSVASAQSGDVKSAKGKAKNSAEGLGSNKRQKTGKADTSTIGGASSNIQEDRSVLGAIKPRKRQNSILGTLRIAPDDLGSDSSAIDSDDEERFLPDDISTPAPLTRSNAQSETVRTSSSLKRKRGAEVAIRSGSTDGPSSPPPSLPATRRPREKALAEIPQPSRSQQRKLSMSKRASKAFDEIMAPPESSDSEDEPAATEAQPVHQIQSRREKPAAPSTQQLRSLMPSKQDLSIGGFRPANEFEIQEDSTMSDDMGEDEQGHSAFMPRRATRAAKKAEPPAKEKAKVNAKKVVNKGSKSKSQGQAQARSKSTRVTSSTPSPLRLRTPLPLSSSRAIRGSEAKSPSKQDTVMRDKNANTPLAAKGSTRNTKKRYGGFRRREAGKENQPISLFDSGSASDSGSGSGSIDKEKLKAAKEQAKGPETQAWQKKWADIDDFELEFEEISIPTQSSSPTGMSR